MDKKLLWKLGINEIESQYVCNTSIRDGMGARSFFGKCRVTQSDVFIKFLLFPRSKAEMARFKNEIYMLKCLSKLPFKVAPTIISSGELYEEEILYIVTEKIEGQTLAQWIDCERSSSTVEEQLEVFHRVASAVSMAVPFCAHRDLHPGNIFLLKNDPVWLEVLPNPEVVLVDWGHAFNPLYAQFDDAHDFIVELYERIPKELNGSFYCTPPDVFYPWKGVAYNPGKHDAWALGLLLYKILTGQDLLNFDGFGTFVESLQNKNMDRILSVAAYKINNIEHPAANIIAKVFEGLLSLRPESRMDPATAGRILWDIRIETLKINFSTELSKYIANPQNYTPDHGWNHSSRQDCDYGYD